MALYPEYEWIAYLAGVWMAAGALGAYIWLLMLAWYPERISKKWGGHQGGQTDNHQ